MKRCPRCGESKPHEAFSRAAHTKDGLQGWCKECMKARRKQEQEKYNTAAQPWQREYKLKTRYGLTVEEYDAMLTAQGGVCALCGKPPELEARRFPADHDHQTGDVRGILCTGCNLKIGRADISFTDDQLAYIHQFSG